MSHSAVTYASLAFFYVLAVKLMRHMCEHSQDVSQLVAEAQIDLTDYYATDNVTSI